MVVGDGGSWRPPVPRATGDDGTAGSKQKGKARELERNAEREPKPKAGPWQRPRTAGHQYGSSVYEGRPGVAVCPLVSGRYAQTVRLDRLASAVAYIVVVVMASATPAAGASSFSAPTTVAASGLPELSAHPSVAVNASGESVVAWNAQLRGRAKFLIDVRRGEPSGHLGPVQQVGEGASPEVSIAANGTAAVMWSGGRPGHDRELLVASIAAPGRPFGRPQKLLLAKATVPGFSIVATDERVVALWGQSPLHGQSAVRYAIAAGGRRFGPAHTVGPSFDGFLDGAGADAGGDVIACYDAPPPASTDNSRMAAAALPAGASSFRGPETLAPSLVAQNGNPYAEPDGANFGDGPGGIAMGFNSGTASDALISTTLGPGLSFSPPVPVGKIPQRPDGLTTSSGPALALPSEGGQIAAWTVGRSSSGDTESSVTGSLMVSSEQADGSFSAPVSLSRPPTLSQYPVAAATDDTAIVAWGEGQAESEHLVYSVRAAGRSFTLPRRLARGVLRQATIAGAGKHAVIAWITGDRLQMARLTG
jgi:hypothetical protein